MTEAALPHVDALDSPECCDTRVAGHWSALRQGNCGNAREALFLHYSPYTKALAAGAFANRSGMSAEFGDYRQWASVGLLEAIDRFDPAAGVMFKTFATPRIRGAILNGIERFSDAHQQLSFRARVRRERLESIKGGPARSQSLDALTEVATGLMVGLLLEGTGLYAAEGEQTPSSQPGAYEAVAWAQKRRSIQAAVEALPERLRQVIRLHYFHGVTFSQIAAMLGVSPARISQLHRTALEALRQKALSSNHHRSPK